MSYLKSCCGCASLSVGSAIIGWLNLLCALIEIIVISVALRAADSKESEFLAFLNPVLNETASTTVMLLLSVILAVKIIGFICSGFLILGATSRKRFHLLPHLMFELVYIVSLLICWFAMCINTNKETDNGMQDNKIIFIIIFTIYTAFNIYLWICVLSLFQQIRCEERRTSDESFLIAPVDYGYTKLENATEQIGL